MNVKPFRVKKNWYYILKRKMYGPFPTQQRCQEVYEIAKNLSAATKGKSGRYS